MQWRQTRLIRRDELRVGTFVCAYKIFVEFCYFIPCKNGCDDDDNGTLFKYGMRACLVTKTFSTFLKILNIYMLTYLTLDDFTS